MRVCIEGIDGSGKTVLSKRLAEHFGWPRFAFPDRTTPAGTAIDAYLRHGPMVSSNMPYDLARAAFLFQCLQFTNRLEKTAELLAAPDCIMDRYWPSGVAYGTSDGLDFDWLVRCGEALSVQPDVFILLNVNPVAAMSRLEKRAQKEIYDRSEAIERANGAYLRLWDRMIPNARWWVIHAGGTEDDVFNCVAPRIQEEQR